MVARGLVINQNADPGVNSFSMFKCYGINAKAVCFVTRYVFNRSEDSRHDITGCSGTEDHGRLE